MWKEAYMMFIRETKLEILSSGATGSAARIPVSLSTESFDDVLHFAVQAIQ